jgi:adenosine deaminase
MDDPRNEGKPITEAFLRALPKTDVHLHLDGSVRIQTLIDLAKVSAL